MARLGSICFAVLVCTAFCYSIADAQSATDVIAYYTDYDPPSHNYSLHELNVACAGKCGDQPLEWRKKYGWIAFSGAQAQDECGKCLNLTNTKTKAHIVARIVDVCGEGLDLDLDGVFDPLDTDGSGKKLGHLTVNYDFVDCGDCTSC